MTLIMLEPDMSIEPGHQVIVLTNNAQGQALAMLLTGGFVRHQGGTIRVDHTYDVDKNIVKLIDELAHVRFSAPNLVQMTMAEVTE
jgi:hypothetical protein